MTSHDSGRAPRPMTLSQAQVARLWEIVAEHRDPEHNVRLLVVEPEHNPLGYLYAEVGATYHRINQLGESESHQSPFGLMADAIRRGREEQADA